MKIKFPEFYNNNHCIEFFNGFVYIDKDGCQQVHIDSKESVFHCTKLKGTKAEMRKFMTQKIFPLAQTIETDFNPKGFVLIKDNIDKKLYFSDGTSAKGLRCKY